MQAFKDSFVCRILIDNGPFCGCWEVMDKETGDFHYLKIIEKSQLETPKITDNFTSEISLIGSLNFPTIPKLISFFDDESNFYVVFEKPRGESLYECVRKNDKTDKNIFAKKFSISFIQIMQYLFTKIDSSIQWNISSETIFLNNDGSISEIYVFFKDSSLITLRNEITMKTTAPEILTHNKTSQKCISWFLGCELFFILNGYYPYEGSTVEEIQHKILYSHPIFLSQLSKDCFDFIKSLLIKNPQMRISLEKAARMPFIGNNKSNSSISFFKSLSADRILVRNSIPSSLLFCNIFNGPFDLPNNEEDIIISSEAECETETEQSDKLYVNTSQFEKKKKKKKEKKLENTTIISDELSNNNEFHLKTNFSYSTDIPKLSCNKNINDIQNKSQMRHNRSFVDFNDTRSKIHFLGNTDISQVQLHDTNLYNSKSFICFYDKKYRNKVPLTPRKYYSPLKSFGLKNLDVNKKNESL